jgi:hypothetical protein
LEKTKGKNNNKKKKKKKIKSFRFVLLFRLAAPGGFWIGCLGV